MGPTSTQGKGEFWGRTVAWPSAAITVAACHYQYWLSTVHACSMQEKNLDWFPRMRAMSLAADDAESEQNELRNLQLQLAHTNELVETLSRQLNDLKEQVSNHLWLKNICRYRENLKLSANLYCLNSRSK